MKAIAFLPVMLLPALFHLAACQGAGGGEGSGAPGDTSDTQPYAGIGEGEIVSFVGTEPFWGGQVDGATLTYSTPEDMDGTTATVERFAGRGGISYSGILNGADLRMAVTPGACSDGMSDITYPFVVTLMLGRDVLSGCGWTDRQPRTGMEDS